VKIDEKQKKILIALGVVIYLIFFVKFNLNQSIPSISANSKMIDEAELKLEALENDLNQISALERTQKQLVTANQRYSDFISQNAETIDSMEYIEKLKRLFNNKIQGVSFESPKEVISEVGSYYSFTTNFKVKFRMSELKALSSFVEGGAKKITITKLNISTIPNIENSGETNQIEKKPSIEDQDIELNMDIAITMYSIEKSSVEMFYEMSRKKLEKFVSDGIVFIPQDNNLSGNLVSINLGGGDNTPPPKASRNMPDFVFRMYSFFSGGSNFFLVGNKGENNQYGELKVQERQNVVLKLNNYVYSVDCLDSNSKLIHFSGQVPNRDIYVTLVANFPEIIENKDLAIDLKIINDSDHNISVYLEGKREKLKILDRNGNQVITKGEVDKICIL
jgi:hypothetical protein